jgi:poly(3-hydroxybutyrate) depolymerase
MEEHLQGQRVAGLRLRGVSGSVQVAWPPATTGAPELLVFLPDDGRQDAGRGLSARSGAVVLWPSDRVTFDEAVAMVEWAADHAGELGADARRLLIAGEGAGAGLAAAVAAHARHQGWPDLREWR